MDALAVFVNKDNPIKCLSVAQVDAIFSKSRRHGAKEDVKTWGQLGLTGDWASRPISLYGRNSASGTYGFFKEHMLKNGDYKDEVKEQPGSASVVQGVTVDRYAIGYSGIGYATAGVRAVPIAEQDRRQVRGGHRRERLRRQLPAGPVPLRVREQGAGQAARPADPGVRRSSSSRRRGRSVVVKDGYFPIPASIAKEELNKIQ